MAGRKPGTNGSDNEVWVDVDPEAEWEIPDIPAWVSCTEECRSLYYSLASLPQAQTWDAGEWFTLWASLPAASKYLSTGSAEAMKSLLGAWGAGLSLTQQDMKRAHMRITKKPDEVEAEAEERRKAAAAVTDEIGEARRKRLLA